MKHNIKFNIDDKVKIVPLNCDGIILSIWIVRSGITYETRYFLNGELKTTYFYDHELTLKG
jgi:hypothetical protein